MKHPKPAPAVPHIGRSTIQSGPAADGRPDLTARLDAEWNAAIDAAANEASVSLLKFAPIAIPNRIRAIRRNPKEGV